jgi:predicted ATP-dependent protease
MADSELRDGDETTRRWRLTAAELDVTPEPSDLGFRTTDELEPLDRVIGQDRALRSLEFGLVMRQRGYNIYVSGITGTGRKRLIQELLQKQAARDPTPDDWIYLHNFDEPDSPRSFRLASGLGGRLRTALQELVERLRQELPKALRAKDFDAERERLGAQYGQRSETLFNNLVERARKLDMGIRKMPNGTLLIIPLKEGRPMESAEVDQLKDAEREEIVKKQEVLGEYLAELSQEQQELSRQLRGEVEQVIRGVARSIIEPLLERIKKDLPLPELVVWLDQARDHMLEHLERFQEADRKEPTDLSGALRAAVERRDPLLEYRVNVVVDNSHTQGAPVLVEISPNYKNLFGTIEREVNLFGYISVDFTGIKAGSLLRANGGYLIFDIDDALTEPLVWKQLKRTLKSGLLLTDVYEPFGILSTMQLKPRPIPTTTKVVLVGSPELYYLLQYYDDDFLELFKVRADFGLEADRSPESHQTYARFVARLVQREKLLPFDAGAVNVVIRYGMREAAHQGKLSLEFGKVADVVSEASQWAKCQGARTVTAEHVQRALEERVYRSDRVAAKVRELIAEGTLRIAIDGVRVGQINGLSLLDLGDYRFGRPSRVSAAVGVGQDGVINIERESELSGSTHNKGILILDGYLRRHYGRQHPIALSASIAFEQSYGWVEGDSASAAELYCLLSAIADVPLKQDIAVTGSVNQHGEIQAIGAVNEKIEGFYDVCRQKGLTGRQGVCIPRANVRHLILRPDVVEAVRAGRFHVWAIDSVDEGIELLTGMPAGEVDREGSFHHRLDQRLREILEVMQEQPTTPAPARLHIPPGMLKPASPPLPGQR